MRNDTAREKLREQVGDVGLIMYVFSSYVKYIDVLITLYRTLYESKGLEFNDVGFPLLFYDRVEHVLVI